MIGHRVSFELSRVVDRGLWAETAERCPWATFFHHPLWFEAFTRTFPDTRVATRALRFPSGRTAIVPLLAWKRSPLLPAVHWCGPAHTYGGAVCAEELSAAESGAIVDWLLARHPNLTWRMNPYAPHAAEILARSTVLLPQATRADSTEVLCLGGFADEEALLAHYRPASRRQVKKGEREGLVARIATEWPEWEVYYRLYEGARVRWGETAGRAYPETLFRALHAIQGREVLLWVVEAGGRIVGGELFVYRTGAGVGGHCAEWHAAYDPESFALGSRNTLVHAIACDALRRGIHHFDFNPSGSYEGTRTFKQTFNTTNTPAPYVERRSFLYRNAEARKFYYRLRRRHW